MRRLIIATIAFATLIGAGSLIGTRAEAMPLAGLAGQTSAEPVRLVCKRVWNGYAWVRECVEVYDAPRYAPRYVEPSYRPQYGYGGGYGGGYRY